MPEFKTPWGKKLGRPLRIFGTPWHVAHQFELLKLPETEWFFIENFTRHWGTVARPEPANLTWVSQYDPGAYDLAILHVDQQCVFESIGKGKLFRELNSVVQDIPKIVLCHGTPYWPEMFSNDEIIDRMKKMLGPLTEQTVMNSQECVDEWGFGHHIQHGMPADEWYDLPKEPRVVTCLSPAGLDKYYNRQLLSSVQEILRTDHNIRHCHISLDFKPQNWDELRRFVGSSLIYFNPTLESPMPRSRTEAMLSGAAIVTLPNHDIAKYLVDGESAVFVKNNPQDCVEKIVELFYDYKRCIKLGKAARKVAMEHFSMEAYQAQWTDYLVKTLSL